MTGISVTARNYTTLNSPYKLDLLSIPYMSYVSHTYLSLLFFSLNIEAYHACVQYLYLRILKNKHPILSCHILSLQGENKHPIPSCPYKMKINILFYPILTR